MEKIEMGNPKSDRKMKSIHDHALTHFKRTGSEPPCERCGDPLFGGCFCMRCECHRKYFNCWVCDQTLPYADVDSFYICVDCSSSNQTTRVFHSSCADDYPEEIQLSYRPGCFIKLQKRDCLYFDERWCDFCSGAHGDENFRYKCGGCDFQINLKCASELVHGVVDADQQVHVDHFSHQHPLLLSANAGGDHVIRAEKIRHFNHDHFLFPLESLSDNNISCSVCEKDIETKLAFGCEKCNFYLHKSCAELPEKIQHHFCRHPLTMLVPEPSSKERQCSACRKYYNGFGYCCDPLDECGYKGCSLGEPCCFDLCLDCSLLLPSIKLQSVHEHPLTLFDKLYGARECQHCHSSSSPHDQLPPMDLCYVRCVKCDFSCHFLCCPLPQNLDLPHYHPHSLKLEDNFIDIFDGFEDDQFCCDVCETRQDARECTYHCEDCKFVVGFECVFSEVMKFLDDEKSKDAQMRIISRKIISRSYEGMIESLTEEEQESLAELKQRIEECTDQVDIFEELEEFEGLSRAQSEESSLFHRLTGYHTMAECRSAAEWIRGAVKELARGRIQLRNVDVTEELVPVGEFKISRRLEPFLRNLIHKYWDIATSSPLKQTINIQSIFLIHLCSVMEEMKRSRISGIHPVTILYWWLVVKVVQMAGIRADFALDHVKTIAKTYLVMEMETTKRHPLYEVHEKIALLSESIDAQKEEIEGHKKRARIIVSSHIERGIPEATRLNQVLGMWHKNLSSGILDDDNFEFGSGWG